MLIENEKFWAIKIENGAINQLYIDYALSFRIDSNKVDLTIRIGCNFTITIKDEEFSFEAETLDNIKPVKALLFKNIETFRTYKDGMLEICIAMSVR